MQRIAINGIETDYISAMDRGLHYGDGVFETIACLENRLQFWTAHIERMAHSAKQLDIAFPGESAFLNDIRNLAIGMKNADRFVIKLMLTRGSGERGYRKPDRACPCRMAVCSEWPAHTTHVAARGARVKQCAMQISVNPALAGIKHLNRLDNVLARNEWRNEFDEGMMSDGSDIIEGTMSNLFTVRSGTLLTPSLQRCGINGIIRQQLIDIAIGMNLPVRETRLSREDLYTMDEIMLCNSIIGIWPVTEYDSREFKTGKVTALLGEALEKRARENAQVIG